jgi:hypothetical protein
MDRNLDRARERERERERETEPQSLSHLSVHQWVRSAVHASQQAHLSYRFRSLKLPPPPSAVLLVLYYLYYCQLYVIPDMFTALETAWLMLFCGVESSARPGPRWFRILPRRWAQRQVVPVAPAIGTSTVQWTDSKVFHLTAIYVSYVLYTITTTIITYYNVTTTYCNM